MSSVELKVGDVVRISGAYSKSDNAMYVVTNAPGVGSWQSSSFALYKCKKDFKPSSCKYAITFWPLIATTNNRYKRQEANSYNKENAKIEVIGHTDPGGFIEEVESIRWIRE